jgi:hypothetical protein
MSTENYVRKPFPVQAERVTTENIEELAEKCRGTIFNSPKGAFIDGFVKKTLDPRHGQAYVGDWLVEYQGGWKVYTNRAFRATFDRAVSDQHVDEPLSRLANIFQSSGQVTDEDLQQLAHTVNERDAVAGKRS